MTASDTNASGDRAEPQAPSAKDRAFWHAIWVIHGVSWFVAAFSAIRVGDALKSHALAHAAAVMAGAVVFAASRYLLWWLTRPYASTADASPPVWSRATLCNVDLSLVLAVSIGMVPKGMSFPDDLLAIAGPILIGLLTWIVLNEPLKVANARDAAANAARTTEAAS